MSRLTRDGTAEPVSRDQILRHARGQGNIIFSVQLNTSRIDNLTRLIHTLLYVMTIHTYIHTYIIDVASIKNNRRVSTQIHLDVWFDSTRVVLVVHLTVLVDALQIQP